MHKVNSYSYHTVLTMISIPHRRSGLFFLWFILFRLIINKIKKVDIVIISQTRRAALTNKFRPAPAFARFLWFFEELQSLLPDSLLLLKIKRFSFDCFFFWSIKKIQSTRCTDELKVGDAHRNAIAIQWSLTSFPMSTWT